MIVTIPSPISKSIFFDRMTFEINDKCPKCGKPRGELFGTIYYDGKRKMIVDDWNNDCGHIDEYSEIRKEGKLLPFKKPELFNSISNSN